MIPASEAMDEIIKIEHLFKQENRRYLPHFKMKGHLKFQRCLLVK